MTIARIPCSRVVLAAALACLTVLCSAPAGAAPPPPGIDAVTERIREILKEDGGDPEWGADPPAAETATRAEPSAATTLSGSGHAMVMFGSDGRPMGHHLRLLHVSVEGDRVSASDCVLSLGRDEDRSCPPAPLALVSCAAWSVPADVARTALLEARAALFVRVYEKKFLANPRQESLYEGDEPGGVVGGISGGTTVSFAAVANVRESGEYPKRVAEEWAGYKSGRESGRYARADAATRILREAFPRPNDAPESPPPPAVHAELSRLLATLPLDAKYWWWVRERLVLMAATLGEPADLARLKGYLTPKGNGPSDLRTRAYALEALARRTGRDPRCDGGRRLADEAAAAAWAAGRER
jgi:hypothetical protein